MVTLCLFFIALLPFAAFHGIAVYMIIAPCYDKLEAPTFIEYFQKLDPYMKVWGRNLVLAQLILTAILVVVQRHMLLQAEGLLTLLAFFSAVVSLMLAVKGNMPLNRQMEQWIPSAPPADWAQVRDRWLRLHVWRGACEIVGFLALLAASFLHTARC